MISLGALLIVVAIIIYIVIGIWYGVVQPVNGSSTANWFLAAATFLLIIGLVLGSYSLMMYGAGSPHEHHLLSCLKGVTSPLELPSEHYGGSAMGSMM